MVSVREVATVAVDNDEAIVIEVMKPLNGDILDGIDEWSHCWVLFVRDTDMTVNMELFAITQPPEGRRIRLTKLRPFSTLTLRIFDIKPLHSADLTCPALSPPRSPRVSVFQSPTTN